MAKTRRPGFLGSMGERSADDIRGKYIDEPLAAATQPALGTALKLLQFVAAMPDAVAASRRRELERVKASGGDDDPRIAALEASIAYAGHASAAANLARTRVQRIAAGAMSGEDVLFRGFVSTPALAPLEGMTVRLVRNGDQKDAKALSATTEKDGYFSIPRPSKTDDIWRAAKSGEGGIEAADTTAVKREVSVEVVDRSGTVMYRDPTKLDLDGSAYREYTVNAEAHRSQEKNKRKS